MTVSREHGDDVALVLISFVHSSTTQRVHAAHSVLFLLCTPVSCPRPRNCVYDGRSDVDLMHNKLQHQLISFILIFRVCVAMERV